MPFTRVDPDDDEQVRRVHAIGEAAQSVDDPDAFPTPLSVLAAFIRYGSDLEPEQFFLYAPDGDSEPVGIVALERPTHDNLTMMWPDITVHPAHRRRGHGSTMLAWGLDQARASGRTTIWVGTPADDPGAIAFAAHHGFRVANADIRRRQVLSEVDGAEVDRLEAVARAAAAEYRLERLRSPLDDEALTAMIEVKAAINDAPMGTLNFENERWDLARLRDIQTARERSGRRVYRVIARHTGTGVVGGHTELFLDPAVPAYGRQSDTAVARAHRGHRLGLLLKIEMLRWLAEAEPQLTEIETWNNADNPYMISVNEALGYRISRHFQMWERLLA